MSFCAKCISTRIVHVSAKCGDMFNADYLDHSYCGYVPADIGIGHGDYISFSYCLNCGQIQDSFPLPKSDLENSQELSKKSEAD